MSETNIIQSEHFIFQEGSDPSGVYYWDSLNHYFWQQTSEYGEIQKQSGREVKQIMVLDAKTKTIRGYFQLIIYPGLRDTKIGYIPHGPAFFPSEKFQRDLLGELEHNMLELGKTYGLIFIRLEPESHTHLANQKPIALGSPIPLHTYRSSFNQPRGEVSMDLMRDEETLWQFLSKGTKRNMKKAQNNNLKCNFHYGKEIETYVDEYIALNKENTASHGTTTHSDEYFTKFFNVISNNEHNFIARVTHNDVVVAINVFVVWDARVAIKHAFCPFGASNDQGKKIGAYYLIKWESIKEMKKNKISNFNWGGVSVGYNDQNLSSLNQFKQGFEKHTLNLGPLHDIVISPVWYRLYLLRSWLFSWRKS